jgi:pseudaminic acid biosynthesis-associated methylase
MQIDLWRGKFGNEYTARNLIKREDIGAREALWEKIIWPMTNPPQTVAEIGAGCGRNLSVLHSQLGPRARLIAVEPNAAARQILFDSCTTAALDVLDGEAEAIPLADGEADLVFTSGVLIHIPPERLPRAMAEIHRVSARWIVAIEYFNPSPIEIVYRNQVNALWKADYGSMYLDMFPDMRCVAYGFEWKRATGLDDVTWWLLEKGKSA